jgi:DNA-binding phage protein
MSNHLARVQDAANRAASSHDALIAEVRAAIAAGVPLAHVAQAASVTRQTVYRWTRGADYGR